MLQKVIFYFSLFCTILIVHINNDCFSQNETGTRYLNSLIFEHSSMWYDSNTAMFQKKYPIIRNLPPLNTGMPYDILLSYIYLDSLLISTKHKQTDSIIKSWTTMNSNLSNTLKYLYKIIDYNPIIFKQYCNEVSLNRKDNNKQPFIYYYHADSLTGEFNGIIDTVANDTSNMGLGKYTNDLINLVPKLCSKIWNLANDSLIIKNSKVAYWSALYSDYIFKIKVLKIDSIKNKNTPLNYKRYNVTAQVLDTLKGQIYIPYLVDTQIKKTINRNQSNESFSLIQFEYTPKNYIKDNNDDSNKSEFKLNDSLFQDYFGNFKMDINQEAIVFLKHCNYLVDYQNDYYDLDLEPSCSNNALPLINGQVRDLNHYWSSNNYINYLDWKNIYLQVKNQIINKSY